MTTIFFYVLLFQIKDWDKICEEEGVFITIEQPKLIRNIRV